ncbi:MAG: aminomethyl-transferring glycine dehydrogenase [Planctomycetota bacterium]
MSSHPVADTSFIPRHLGPAEADRVAMLAELGYSDLDAFLAAVVPQSVRSRQELDLPSGRDEHHALADLRAIAGRNKICRSYIGMGYNASLMPSVIKRMVLENPGWYTPYTPYQAEIAQGRLEGLLAFQTVIADLTGLPVANASLLDEATAAAEAMTLAYNAKGGPERNAFFVARDCHPQTIDVLRTRAWPLGIEIIIGDSRTLEPGPSIFGALLQYPATDGAIHDHAPVIERCHAIGALAIVAADPLALCVLRPPGEFGADICIGSVQRFGLPLAYGGPHAGYFACQQRFLRRLPGRLVGVSRDADGRPALRLALQTREQHIRREKATSNICTAQALLANLAAFYAIHHGPAGLRSIAERVHAHARVLAAGLQRLGLHVGPRRFFDTVRVDLSHQASADILERAEARGVNLRSLDSQTIGISLDETVDGEDVEQLWAIFAGSDAAPFTYDAVAEQSEQRVDEQVARSSAYLTDPLFHSCRSETAMMRYIKRLEQKDVGLAQSMIPLGSCTMKLSPAAAMAPITWSAFADIHPFVPPDQARGYRKLFQQLEQWLAAVTRLEAVSLQPNAGSQGEYAGLLAIRAYHKSRGQGHRRVCLIPASAHGTNPASARMAGMEVVDVACDDQGNIDLTDLSAKAEAHAEDVAALMITYPSTHGVFEETVREVCDIVHRHGAQVYMDGANMNAQMGLCSPGDVGADVCHLNLHKTFAIPHGGGGPGVGPICVARHLAPFLPQHPVIPVGSESVLGAVAAAPYGSAGITMISWMYIAMMGGDGLAASTAVAILNANYIARRLAGAYEVLYTGPGGLVAHECILDLRPFRKLAGVTEEDVAKRLMDFGFHAPTVSFPVAGTLMVEPTESEPREELDRFCEAMLTIREEIDAIAAGTSDAVDNPLKHAPHPAATAAGDDWEHAYSRTRAVWPLPWVAERKYWPPVARIDNVYGDRNLRVRLPVTLDEP